MDGTTPYLNEPARDKRDVALDLARKALAEIAALGAHRTWGDSRATAAADEALARIEELLR